MRARPLQGVISYLRRAVAPGDGSGTPDAQLLERYAVWRDEPAFELLVWRHAQTVLGVCRRVLRDDQAEDAFQATFLALAREAKRVGRRGSVGGWLHRVAYRVALKAKARAARQAAHERPLEGIQSPSPQPEPYDVAVCRELEAVLDEAVNRLPDKYREAFVLCVLAGKSNADAAVELGCPVGTVESRLARARERLRVALARRGFALGTPRASVPPPLVSATVQAATLFVEGQKAGLVSPGAVALVEELVRETMMSGWRSVAALMLAVGLLGLGGVALERRGSALEGAKATARAPAPKKVDKELIQGNWNVVNIQANGKHPAQEVTDGQRWHITTDRITITYADGSSEQFTYRLGPKHKPRRIDLETIGGPDEKRTFHALYELDGDQLKVCKDRNRRPAALDIGEGDRGRILFTLKREAAKKAARKEEAKVILTLESASATPWGKDVLFECRATLENRTGKELKVRSSFFSVFDGTWLVIQDEKGKELKRQSYVFHQSPFSVANEHRLPVGKTTKTIAFPVGQLPKGQTRFKVQLAGTLPGSGYERALSSKVLEVQVKEK
jgi:RNA polymerase sigma factor (sigma-70 family)